MIIWQIEDNMRLTNCIEASWKRVYQLLQIRYSSVVQILWDKVALNIKIVE
jgi:hypothetical protein